MTEEKPNWWVKESELGTKESEPLPFYNPQTSAVKSHLRAALHALGEHDCASTRRHIEEALNLL